MSPNPASPGPFPASRTALRPSPNPVVAAPPQLPSPRGPNLGAQSPLRPPVAPPILAPLSEYSFCGAASPRRSSVPTRVPNPGAAPSSSGRASAFRRRPSCPQSQCRTTLISRFCPNPGDQSPLRPPIAPQSWRPTVPAAPPLPAGGTSSLPNPGAAPPSSRRASASRRRPSRPPGEAIRRRFGPSPATLCCGTAATCRRRFLTPNPGAVPAKHCAASSRGELHHQDVSFGLCF